MDNKGERASKFPPPSSSSSALLPDDYQAIAKLSNSLDSRKDFLCFLGFRIILPALEQRATAQKSIAQRMLRPVLNLKLLPQGMGYCVCQSTSPLIGNSVHYRGKNPKPSITSIHLASCLLPPLREDAAVPISLPSAHLI